jgi:hypothetical protein
LFSLFGFLIFQFLSFGPFKNLFHFLDSFTFFYILFYEFHCFHTNTHWNTHSHFHTLYHTLIINFLFICFKIFFLFITKILFSFVFKNLSIWITRIGRVNKNIFDTRITKILSGPNTKNTSMIKYLLVFLYYSHFSQQ